MSGTFLFTPKKKPFFKKLGVATLATSPVSVDLPSSTDDILN